MKNKSVNMLIVALLLLAALSVTLVVFLADAKENFPKDITVDEDGVSETILQVRDLHLNPTESREYSVNLYCAASGAYDVSLDYEETLDGGLKHFVTVTVKANGATVYEGSLADLLDGTAVIRFNGELNEKRTQEPLVLTITYHMPRSVGNEAQRTYANFDVKLKIVKS